MATATVYASGCVFYPSSSNAWLNPSNANGVPGADYSSATVDSVVAGPASFLASDITATPIPGTALSIYLFASISCAAAPASAGLQIYLTDGVGLMLVDIPITASAQTTYSGTAAVVGETIDQLADIIRNGHTGDLVFYCEGTSSSATPTEIRVHGVWMVVNYATADQLTGGADDSLLLTGIRR